MLHKSARKSMAAAKKLTVKKLAVKKTTSPAATKKTTKIARGTLAKWLVFSGRRLKTVGGLTRAELMRNKRNKVVSKKAHAWGKKIYHQIKDWVESFMEARSCLAVSGFVPINGKTLLGKQIYMRTKSLYSTRKEGPPQKTTLHKFWGGDKGASPTKTDTAGIETEAKEAAAKEAERMEREARLQAEKQMKEDWHKLQRADAADAASGGAFVNIFGGSSTIKTGIGLFDGCPFKPEEDPADIE